MELFQAVSENNVIKVVRLLERGVDPNQFDIDQRYNALHYAVQNNAIDVVLLLITAGADLDTMTEDNQTVFDIARIHRNEEMLDFLIKISHMRIGASSHSQLKI